MPSWRGGQRLSESNAGYMRAVVPLAAISTHCPCKAGWVHICDKLSGAVTPTGRKVGMYHSERAEPWLLSF
jgi:hypothetical protein